VVLVHCGNNDIADWGLEFDQRMSWVMLVAWASFAVATEVGVIAHSTLITNAVNVALILLLFAQRSVTVNAIVMEVETAWFLQRIVDRYEPVDWVDEWSVLNTLRAEIPIGAIQTLVADTEDELVELVYGNCSRVKGD